MIQSEWNDGWWSKAQRIDSPNFDARPVDARVEAIVIHSISLPPGEYDNENVEQFFCNKLDHQCHRYFAQIEGMCVSSHFYIRRNGAVIQFVSGNDRAWHAGESNLHGRERVNDFSIGIELQGLDTDSYCSEQYRALGALTNAIRAHWPRIDATSIVAHSDIAPARKTDPGPWFDWQQYWNEFDELS